MCTQGTATFKEKFWVLTPKEDGRLKLTTVLCKGWRNPMMGKKWLRMETKRHRKYFPS